VAAEINCSVNQADIQLRVDLELLVIGVDTNTPNCGLGGTQGLLIFDVSDPRSPTQLSVYKHARGAHNATFHPTAPLIYISDSDVAPTAGLGNIPIVDVSDPANPTLVGTFAFHVHSPHDIAFNATGTRAYVAGITHTDILDTTNPKAPTLISTIHDPSINISHQADPTPDGKYLVISDELAGAAAGPACPGGGLHFYDITNESRPVKVGVFFIPQVGPAAPPPATGLCTAHVFRIHPDSKTMTIGWYWGGTWVLDISNPGGAGTEVVGSMNPSGLGGNAESANSWASKTYKGYIYSNDRRRGLDIMQLGEPGYDAATGGDAVVALIDTGINPYHVTFRDSSPRALQHPSTYIPGYPEDAKALPITLDQPNWAAAVKKDCELWKTVEPRKLYWFPGTKIVGAYSVAPSVTPSCTNINTRGTEILDYGGHGTMTASRMGSVEYGACRECLIVSVQDPLSINLTNPSSDTPRVISAIRWAADNASWIDAQSNSWGPFAPAWDPTGTTGLLVSSPALVRAVEEVSQKHAAYWASGNGALFRFGVLGHPTLLAPHFAPSAIMVGGMDSGYVNTWPGFSPHVISDSCNSWAAHNDSTTDSAENVGGGTSGATPFAAGGAGRLLLEARSILGDPDTGVSDGAVARGPAGLVPSGPLADGVFTVAEWKEIVFKTATARPRRQFEDGSVCSGGVLYDATPVRWQDIPEAYPEFLQIGYGAVDADARRLALSVLHGNAPMPDRARTDTYFALDMQARSALHQVFRLP
jgi:hypothetical protein